MERETGIEPALVAWKATVLPLNYSRFGAAFPLLQPLRFRRFDWWRKVDSNHRRHEPTDLQSVPFGRLGIPPANEPGILTVRPPPVNGREGLFRSVPGVGSVAA